MKTLFGFATVIAVAIVVNPARAALISVNNTTTSTTILADDGYEDDTAGTFPNPPTTGSYGTTAGTSPTNYSVLTGGSPGPYDGGNYLKINRVAGGAENTARLDAAFSTAPATGETIKAAFAFFYQSNGANTSSVAIRVLTAAGAGTAASNANTRFTIIAEPDYGTANWYVINGISGAVTNTTLAATPGQWQTIGIEYTVGSTDLTLTANGVSQTLTGAANNTQGVNRIRFNTGASNTTYYVDAVPEPTGLLLAGISTALGLGSIVCRRRRKAQA